MLHSYRRLETTLHRVIISSSVAIIVFFLCAQICVIQQLRAKPVSRVICSITSIWPKAEDFGMQIQLYWWVPVQLWLETLCLSVYDRMLVDATIGGMFSCLATRVVLISAGVVIRSSADRTLKRAMSMTMSQERQSVWGLETLYHWWLQDFRSSLCRNKVAVWVNMNCTI